MYHQPTDSARAGLGAMTSARANAAAAAAAAALKAPPQQAAPREQQPTEKAPRLSGGKRDHDTAASTDVVNHVPGSAPTVAPPLKKKKVTYTLPHQNMEEGHFYVVLGEDVDVSTGRFKMLSLLGEGTFGKVVEAWDRKRKEYCAVKVVRNVAKYTRDAQIEIKFMENVRAADPSDRFPMMKIQRHFRNDQGHVCIVMPKYGPCLLDHLQRHGPFPHRHLAEVIFQTGVALDGFHSEMRLMHTDLKPENMLLESGETTVDSVTGRSVPKLPCKTRLCDLGGCCDERHSKTAIVSTRHYRSPEVILGLGWMYSTDMWSMGCIIYELATGRLLYDTHDNLEHLHLMEKTLGPLPREWGPMAMPEARPLYSSTGSLRALSDPKHIARVGRARQVRDTVADPDLRDLILGLLRYDKRQRTTARQMTSHPYVTKYFPEAASSPLHPNHRRSLTGTSLPPSPAI